MGKGRPTKKQKKIDGADDNISSATPLLGKTGVTIQTGGPRKLSIHYGGCAQEDHKSPIYSVSFYEPLVMLSDDEDKQPQFFASVGANRATIYRIDTDGALGVAQAYVDEDPDELFYSSCWSETVANSPLFVIGGFRGLIKVINCLKGEIATTLIGHGHAVNELRTHPLSPALILSASKDESIRLWNIYTSCCIAIFAGEQGHHDEVLSVDFHLLGNVFASCGMDNTVKVWSLEGVQSDKSITKNIDESYNYCKREQGFGGGVKQANERERNNGPLEEMFSNKNINSSSSSSSTSSSSSSLSASSTNKEDNIISANFKFRTIHQQFPVYSSSQLHSDYVDCVRWVGNLLLSKSTASKIVLWKPDAFALQGHQNIHATTPSQFPMSSAQKQKQGNDVSSGKDNDEEKPIIESSPPPASSSSSSSSSSLSCTSSSQLFTLPSSSSMPKKSDPGSAIVLKEFEFRYADIWFVRFALNPTYQLMAVGNKHGKLWIWNIDGNPNSVLVKSHGHLKCNSAIRQTAFSPNGKYLVCCCEDGSIWKWSIDS